MKLFFLPFSKDPHASHLFRAKRSDMCNEIERLTQSKRIEFKGFDWSKEVGNEAVGATFGVKSVNYAQMSICKFIDLVLQILMCEY